VAKVDKAWCIKEYLEIAREEVKIKIRKERLATAIQKLADKFDKGTPKNATRKFEVVHGNRKYRCSKIARSTTIALSGVVEDVLGKEAKNFKVAIVKVDDKSLSGDWAEIPKEAKVALKPYTKVKKEYDVKKLNDAFLKGDITKSQLVSMTEEVVVYNVKVSVLKK